ncbi:uroporphyrinogen-III C-methyltransferase [Litchfieldella rifensis]|uniref:Uroporphyrinogen-III C-methyltransferase n=1 Tax=Litchfieldella rifensis TaxID=762643 RepID=A0ABV7LU02_9GAMM
MSKQQHDQDEQQAPSGADASHSDKDASTSAPSETSGATASEPASSAPENDQPESGKSPRSRSRNRRRGKSAANQTDSGQAPTGGGDKPSAGDDKPARTDEQPDSAGKKAATASAGDEPASGASKTPSETGKTPPSGGAAGGGGASGGGTTGDGGQAGKRLGAAALVLAILLAVATLLVGWYGWQRLEAHQQRLAEVESNAEAIADLESRFDASERERQAALDDALASLRSDFSDYRSEVDKTLDRVLDELSSQQNTDEREWLHAEAAYLLRLANQRLQLERDVEGAASLLRTADARLRDADNPALVPVRREIASELAALEAVPRIDRTGLYLSLNAQQQQLARLPLKQDVEQIAAQGGNNGPLSGTWQQQLARFGSELKELVTVRRHDEALEALITPEQESYLRQNVRLVLEQAQLALLKEEPQLYQASLDKAISMVRDYYATDRSGVEATLKRLNELREATVRPELPDISGSQQALATFIERRFESPAQDEQGDEA